MSKPQVLACLPPCALPDPRHLSLCDLFDSFSDTRVPCDVLPSSLPHIGVHPATCANSQPSARRRKHSAKACKQDCRKQPCRWNHLLRKRAR